MWNRWGVLGTDLSDLFARRYVDVLDAGPMPGRKVECRHRRGGALLGYHVIDIFRI